MNIPEFCIKRPVFTSVMMAMLVLAGIVANQQLSLREYPAVDSPVINVMTQYPGATAEIVEAEITTPLEDLISALEGIDIMQSTSRAGTSIINVIFKPGRDLDAAAADVRDRVALSSFVLPKKVNRPQIWKQDSNAFPFFWVSISSDERNPLELTELAETIISDKMAVVEGVSQVVLWAGREYAMRVWVDRIALASFSLTVQDVEDALRKQNVNIPAGRVENTVVEMSIFSHTSLQTPSEFENIIVAEKDGYLVRLKDVANVELGAKAKRKTTTQDNISTLALGARLQSMANPLDVSEQLTEIIAKLQQELPDDIQVNVVIDKSKYIRASIDNVYSTLTEAIVLVILVIFIFLRSFSAMFIPAITIPISLIGTSALMLWWGFSLNTLTLLALVLGIGIVVDDAIVVMENIHRYIEKGLKPKQAAIRGSKEIFFAVIAMTLTLVAVFAPLSFSEGNTGKLFIEFALTLAGAVLISGFVALTLTPMMCSRMLRPHRQHRNLSGWKNHMHNLSENTERFFLWLNTTYISSTKKLTNTPKFSLFVVLIVSITSIVLTKLLPSELAPYEDVGSITIVAIAPEGTNIQYGQNHTRELIDKIGQIPHVKRVFTNYGNPIANMHHIEVLLDHWDSRQKNQFEIHDQLRQLLAATPGLIFISIDKAPFGQSSKKQPINLILQSDMPIDELAKTSKKVLQKLRENPKLKNQNLDLKLNKPQIEINLNREKLADAGIELATVGRTLETLFGGREVTEFQRGTKKYDVMVQLAANERSNPSDIREVYLRNQSGDFVLLEDVVDLQETTVPRQLNHFNKQRVANITATPADGYTLGEALESAIADIEAMQLDDISLDFQGLSREYLNSNQQIYQLALLSLIFIYLVLAAQFESFRDPLIILISVPFAVLGAASVLHLTGNTFSIYTQIGMITLVGLISKHGIMLVDTANRLRYEGVAKYDAIIEACSQRFRPILMTTAAMSLGAVPLALSNGAGAASRAQLGWTIVGGLVGGTILTLLVTPSIYMLISRNKLDKINP